MYRLIRQVYPEVTREEFANSTDAQIEDLFIAARKRLAAKAGKPEPEETEDIDFDSISDEEAKAMFEAGLDLMSSFGVNVKREKK
jgi:hypothetical protein